jgi:ankyrin repeat protein
VVSMFCLRLFCFALDSRQNRPARRTNRLEMCGRLSASLLLFFCIGCSIKPQDLNRVRIDYSMVYGWGAGAYKLTILGNGRVRYEGYRSVGVPGVQEYLIPRSRVFAIVNALNTVDFFSLPETVPTFVMDCSVIRIRYSDAHHHKLVIDNCREETPKHRYRRSLADALRAKDMEPGLWHLSAELDRLADAQRFIHSTLTDYALLASEGWDVNTSDASGWTALAYAVARRDYISTSFLLEHGAVVSKDALRDATVTNDPRPLKMLLATSKIPSSALNSAAISSVRDRNTAVLELLLAAGANPNGDPSSGIPIFDAVRSTSGAAIDILVKHGADVNAKDEQGNTPLIVAAGGSDSGIVAQLIRLGAKIDARDRQGNTALMVAARFCNYWTIIPLLESGAVLHASDVSGRPLMDAGFCGPAGSEKAQRTAELLKTAVKSKT